MLFDEAKLRVQSGATYQIEPPPAGYAAEPDTTCRRTLVMAAKMLEAEDGGRSKRTSAICSVRFSHRR